MVLSQLLVMFLSITITNVEMATFTDIPRSGISTSDIGSMINDDVITMCTY